MTIIEQETMNSIKSACKKYISKQVDWEQRRYEIAKDVLAANAQSNEFIAPSSKAKNAIRYADALIEELKKQ